MAPRRQTIDGMSARIRPRTYADMRPAIPRREMIVDVALPSPSPATPSINTEEIADKARSFVQNIQVPVQVPQKLEQTQHRTDEAPIVQRPLSLRPEKPYEPAKSISEMLSSIQGPIHNESQDSSLVNERHIEERTVKTILSRMFENKRSITVTAMSLLLMVGGTVALVSSFSTNKLVGEQVQALTEVASASVDNESLASDEGMPSEDPVPESVVNAFTPPADEPRYITVPKLKNKKTRVLKMGLDTSNSIKTPRTTWDTGWYEGSSKPGDSVGASLIVGHVSGLTTGGVFYNLYRLVDGDEIIVEMGDGTKYTYRVVGKEEVPLDGINMNNYLISKDIDKPGLTLMTCAGEYNPVTETYENRLAIFAVRDK